MVSINLYQPGKINCTLEFPSSWNDLFPEEVLFICKALLIQTEENAAQTRPNLLSQIINFRIKASGKKLAKGWFINVDAEQLVLDGYPLLNFIFEENNLTTLPEPIRLPYALSFGKGWGEVLYTKPFEELTCGEFEDTEIFINQFYEDPSAEPLANVAAILFRETKHGVIRPYMEYRYKTGQYKTYESAKKVKRFLKLKPERLYAIFAWYAGCCSQLTRYFPNLYDENKSKPGSRDMLAFTKCIHAGAGPKNGTRDKIRVMKLYEFFFDMEQEAIKAKELQAEYDKMKK